MEGVFRLMEKETNSETQKEAIETENFEKLPAPVYIRGFVTEFARYLKIDPERAVFDFMAKYDAYKRKK